MRLRGLLLPFVALVVGLTACESSSSDDTASGATSASSATSSDGELSGTLTVFAAASLTDVFPELGDELMQENPSLQVEFNFAGSSALAAQLLQGAPADVFAAADEIQMARVADAGLATDPLFFAGNPLMLAFPPDDPAGIAARRTENLPSLADLLDDADTVAVCAPEVPCGAAAATLLAAAGLQDAPDTYEDDARAVLTKVQLGEVDAGLVYLSDVHAAGDTIQALAFPEASTAINRYPVAVLTDAPNPEAARAFADLVLSDAGQQILRNAGFLEP
jgi:molybdate transport system substrate-binding protein